VQPTSKRQRKAFDFPSYLNWDPFERPRAVRSGLGRTNSTCVGGPSWPVQSSIARWLCSTIAGPVCADHLNPVRSTFAGKENSSRLRILKHACTGSAPRSRQAIRQQSRPVNHNSYCSGSIGSRLQQSADRRRCSRAPAAPAHLASASGNSIIQNYVSAADL